MIVNYNKHKYKNVLKNCNFILNRHQSHSITTSFKALTINSLNKKEEAHSLINFITSSGNHSNSTSLYL